MILLLALQVTHDLARDVTRRCLREVTIRSVDWVVPIAVTAIGAGAGFIGGYLSARWTARSDLAQWRRDQLLQFCANLLAAGQETVDYARQVQLRKKKPPFPGDPSDRLDHPVACIALLSLELAGPATSYYYAVLDVYTEALQIAMQAVAANAPINVGAPANLTAAQKKAAQERGRFLRSARELMIDLANSPNLWSQLWSRIRPYLQSAIKAIPAK